MVRALSLFLPLNIPGLGVVCAHHEEGLFYSHLLQLLEMVLCSQECVSLCGCMCSQLRSCLRGTGDCRNSEISLYHVLLS